MATENKRLNTRLMLKYDSYENWTTLNPNLLKGEVAIAYIDTSNNTQTHSGQNVPQLLMKVGNGLEGEAGKYNSLPFVSGLAADVYSWAKAANKPSYAITEISGAKEYQVVEGDNEYTWYLQAQSLKDPQGWVTVSTIDLSSVSTRIKAVEDDVADHETRLTAAEGTIGNSTFGLVKDVADLKAAVGSGGSVETAITDAINGLDSTKTQAAGADGLALEVVQENGVITSISGSIAANTYDAHGSAAAVLGTDADAATANTVHGVKKAAAAAQKTADDAAAAVAQEAADRKSAIEALTSAGVEGTQAGTVVKFVDKVSQSNGAVVAELGELVFNSAYDATDNKAATMADVTSAVADLNGAMHFEGVVTGDSFDAAIAASGKTYVAGDVVIWDTIEYVYDGSKWVQLGDETTAGTLISGISGSSTNTVDKTVVAHTQSNGVVTLTYDKIQIGLDQVTGLQDAINGGGTKDTEQDGRLTALEGRATTIEGTDAGKSMRAVAEEVSTTSLNGLSNLNKDLAADETVDVITQENGAVTVTTQKIQIAESQVTGLTAALAAKATNTDLDAAKGRITTLEGDIVRLDGADTVDGSVAQKIKTAITGLSKADEAVAGQFVTSVKQENGVITVSRGAVNVKDLEQTADTYVVFDCGSASVNI